MPIDPVSIDASSERMSSNTIGNFCCSAALFLRPGALDGLATLLEILANALDRIASGREQHNQNHEQKLIHAHLHLTPTAHTDEMPGDLGCSDHPGGGDDAAL